MSRRRAAGVVLVLGLAALGLAACTPMPEPAAPYPVQVSAGGLSSCAVMSDGTVRCWGFPIDGSSPPTTATGTPIGSSTPTEVPGLTGIVQVSVGNNAACAVSGAGSVRCWGNNIAGQLGNGTTTSSATPVLVGGLPIATKVSVGAFQTCAVLRGTLLSGVGVIDGGVRCWGGNGQGQLGNGTTVDSSTPVAVSGIADAVDVSVGRTHGCAITRNPFATPVESRLRCWGSNDAGQLGNGTTTDSTVPVAVGGTIDPTDWTDISVNNDLPRTCGVRGAGIAAVLQCWGADGSTSVTVPNTQTGVTAPTAGTTSGYNVVLAIWQQDCVTEGAGTVRCRGTNNLGEFGDGTTTSSSSFDPADPNRRVQGITNATGRVTNGLGHHCVLRTDRTVACWGNNGLGQLGNGAPVPPYDNAVFTAVRSSLTPVTVAF